MVAVADQPEPPVSATPASEEEAMQIGYARASTDDQRLELQRDALRGAGCHEIFEERCSEAGPRLAAREELLRYVRDGDVVVVWRLDRLGRSLRGLIEVVTGLAGRGIGLRSLRESLDTTSPAGRLTFHIFGALADFDQEYTWTTRRSGRAKWIPCRSSDRVDPSAQHW
jgi:DNA invertase Pin-like site-specific DNA recombinase